MLKIFICEDNLEEKRRLENVIKQTILMERFDMKLFLSTSNPYEVLDTIKKNPVYGLYFLDVDLGVDLNGIELAEQIRKYDPRGFIIFITTHDEMSHLTFLYKVEAMDYIPKDDSHFMSLRVKECLKNVAVKFDAILPPTDEIFSIKTGERVINVNLFDIYYFETSPIVHKVILHSKNRRIEFYGKMKEIEKSLDNSFCRCHSSYIVNRNHIQEINKKERIVYLKNGSTCLISPRGLKSLSN